ncbi:MAG: lysozyme [Terracidiphilus sp.]
MQISPSGIAFIESNEGFAAQVYSDNGKSAIGFGHDLLPGESFPGGVTRAEAELMLNADLQPVQLLLAELAPTSCTQNQWDALCDFGFNLGVESLKTMLAHGWDQVPEQIVRWVYEDVNGVQKVNPGLVARRAAEVRLFNS